MLINLIVTTQLGSDIISLLSATPGPLRLRPTIYFPITTHTSLGYYAFGIGHDGIRVDTAILRLFVTATGVLLA